MQLHRVYLQDPDADPDASDDRPGEPLGLVQLGAEDTLADVRREIDADLDGVPVSYTFLFDLSRARSCRPVGKALVCL